MKATFAVLVLVLFATATAATVNVTVNVNVNVSCVWTNFCWRLALLRNQYVDRTVKSLVFYSCNTVNGNGNGNGDCAVETEQQHRLDLVTAVRASNLQLTEIPRGFCSSEFGLLRNIDLSSNRLNGLAITAANTNGVLEECSRTNANVTVLNLSNNQLETIDLAHLLTFSRLEVVYLDSCELAHIYLSAVDVSNCSLRVLSLSKNKLITFDLNLLSLPSLEMIDLSKNEFNNAPVSFVALRSDSIRLRRLQGVMQNRISDYYLTINLHKANVAGLLEGLARVVTRYSDHNPAQTVRAISRFIDAFDYVRFDMVQAFTECDALCFFDETSTSTSALLPLPNVLRFLAEHVATLKRIVSTSHYEWLMNLLSVRCASVHATSNASISQVLASFDSVQDQNQQDVASSKIVQKLCGGFQHSRVRQFALALRNALRYNASNVTTTTETEFACDCNSCAVKFDALHPSLVIALDCADSKRLNVTLTLRNLVGDSLPALARIVSQTLASDWHVDWPGSGRTSASTNTLRIIPVHIDFNLTASGISQFDDYEPEFGHVRSLTLAANGLRELDENLFRSMHSLRKLDLRRNELRILPSVVILTLHELVDVRLEGNQLDCSCQLYTQLFEAQTLQVLNKLVDFNTLQCVLNATGQTVMLSSVMRNLSNFLTTCPNIERVPVRLPRRPTTAVYALWSDEDTEHPGISYLVRQFLSRNAPYILSICAICIAVLVILCIICIVDYVKLYKARYVQVTQTDPAKRTATGGSFIRNANASCSSALPDCDQYARTEKDNDKFASASASVDRLSLPKQHCEINEYLTNLVNENRHRDDFSRRSGSECIPEATSCSSGRKNLKNVTVIINDLQRARSDSPSDNWAVNSGKNCLNFSTTDSSQDRGSSNARNDQETEGELSDSAQSDRADSEGVTDQSATLQQL